MALKFLEGFEHYATNIAFDLTGFTNSPLILSNSTSNAYKWSSFNSYGVGYVKCVETKYRTPQTLSKSLSIATSTSIHMAIPTNQTIIVGFGYYASSLDTCDIIAFTDSTNPLTMSGLRIGTNPSGIINVGYHNSGVGSNLMNTILASSSSSVLTSGAWFYIEVKISFSTTTGSVEVRVNSNTAVLANNINTLWNSASCSGFNLVGNGSNAFYFDDLYICDTTGTTNNDFLGPLSVYTLFPNGAGSSTDFTVTGAASNYLAVNTDTQTTATYVSSSTTNAKDLYTLADLPITASSIPGVMVHSTSQKGDNGVRNHQLLVKTSGTEAASSDLSSTFGSWIRARAIFENQADGTTAWDTTAVNNMEIGFKNT